MTSSPGPAAPRIAPLLFAVGLVVRVLALPSPGMMDVKAWKAWASHATIVGVARIYGPPENFVYRGEEFYVDYPPGSMVLLWGVGKADAFVDPDGTNGGLFNTLLNLLPLAASVAIALILRRTDPGPLGWWRALAFWCNPAMLLASVLGYQDPIFCVAGLLAVLALMRGDAVLGAALVAGAGLLKPQAVLLLPTLAAVLLAETRWRTWLRAALAGLAVAAVVVAPWWTQGFLAWAIDGSLRPLRETTVAAQQLNVWWIAGYVAQWARDGAWPLARILFFDDFRAVAGWDVRWPSRVLLLAGTLANVALFLRRPADDRLRIPLSVVLQAHLYALFGTSVHENHAFLAVVLAPLLVDGWEKGRRFLLFASGLLLANLFLFEGLGRGIIRDRVMWRLRLAAGLDLTVVVAALHVALVGWLLWSAWRSGPSLATPNARSG